MKMKSQFEHRQDYFANAYKAGLTFQHNLSGDWVDADPKADPSIAPSIFPEYWRVKEHVYEPDIEAIEAKLKEIREEENYVKEKATQTLRQALNVDAVNISEERVDKTAKHKHEGKTNGTHC